MACRINLPVFFADNLTHLIVHKLWSSAAQKLYTLP